MSLSMPSVIEPPLEKSGVFGIVWYRFLLAIFNLLSKQPLSGFYTDGNTLMWRGPDGDTMAVRPTFPPWRNHGGSGSGGSYQINDAPVKHNGGFYVSIEDNNNDEPPSAKWRSFALNAPGEP